MKAQGTGLRILGSALGGTRVVEKLLGPTSEYIGEDLRHCTVKRIVNTAKVFINAKQKLGKKINQKGKVSPRVLKLILEEGSWCEEELQIEYFVGILASSRTSNSRDDRGAYFAAIITKLSVYQLRTHYLLYHALKIQFNDQDIHLCDSINWCEFELFIPYETYYYAMDFSQEEINNWGHLLSHSICGLRNEDLISDLSFGDVDLVKKTLPEPNESGLFMTPSKTGIELFMWAYGLGQKDPSDFFKTDIVFNKDQYIKIGRTISTRHTKKEETLKIDSRSLTDREFNKK